MTTVYEYFVDNFAGGGGASEGISWAIGRDVDVAINHDPEAIALHKVNHPSTKHYCEDIWQVDPVEAVAGNPVALAWFSPDCKHFSRAKGGKPVDKNIRGLAWVAVRWAKKVRPRVIMMENVPEIMTWGPLDGDGRPIKARAGETFRRFTGCLQKLGFTVDWRLLMSCDYGAPTRRKRFYMIARCDGKAIRWPDPKYGQRGTLEVQAGVKKPWRTAAECIDWSLPAQSIFGRKKPLAEKTMQRIIRGLEKFVINNPSPFIIEVNHNHSNDYSFRGQAIDEPLNTVTAKHGYGLVAPTLIQYHDEQHGNDVRGQRLDEPIMTVDTSNRYGLTSAYLVTMHNNQDGQKADEPLGTICASTIHHMAVTAFLTKYYTSGANVVPVTDPLPTVTTKDRLALITVKGAKYRIADIKMRMLQPRELFNAQGFPADYVIDRDISGRQITKSEQVAKCGNAVTPPVPDALVRANLPEYCGGPHA